MKKFIIILILLLCPVLAFAEQVDINSATLSQLDDIAHVGPKTAQKIIDDRPYSSVNDLSKVKGIGNGKYLQDIINQGFACVNCESTPAPTPSPTPTTTPSPTPAITYPNGVFIDEILPNPAGADETMEWIEIYNSNNFDVDLSGWQIQDQQGTITTYAIPKDTNILANGFMVFKRPDTNIMLNNDSDGLNLLTPDGKTEDSMSFTGAPLNQSYNKTNSGWQWSTNSTPGAVNIVTAVQTKTSTKSLPKVKISDNNKVASAAAAGLSLPAQTSGPANPNQDTKSENPWFLFFTALASAIFLAILVLLIKFKFQKNVRT